MAQITEFGFERDNRTDITAKVNNSFRNKFGANLLLTDDSIAGLLRSLVVERSLEYEKLLEDVYYSRTLNGAEGIALDDAASYFGFSRRGPQPSSGLAHIEFVDNGTNLGTDIAAGSTFSASNGVTYSVISGGTLNENITGAVIDTAALVGGNSYTFNITNAISGGVSETTLVFDTVENFSTALFAFILGNTEGNVSSVFESAGIIYIGYASTEEFIGLAQPIYFESVDLPVGYTFWSGYFVEAQTAGFNPLESGGISNYDAGFSGYTSATNTTDFNPGAENETDAEFRLRLQTQQLRTPAGTREALAAAIEALPDVVTYRIYDNPTLVGRAEADALTFNVVVRGGTNAEVAQAIYDNKPLNVGTSGNRLFVIDTADGQIENIRFTQASENEYDFRITYVVNNNSPLSAREVDAVQQSVRSLLESRPIGLGVSNSQLSSSVLVALPVGRLLSVSVEVKRTTRGVSSYSQSDITLDYDQYASAVGFEFVRTT